MPSLYGYDLHFYNWNLKQLQTEKKFDEKQWEELKQNGASGGCIMSGMMEL